MYIYIYIYLCVCMRVYRVNPLVVECVFRVCVCVCLSVRVRVSVSVCLWTRLSWLTLTPTL